MIWLLIFLFVPCFQSKDIRVLDATSRAFEGGRERSGSGIHYWIQVKVFKNSEKLSFESVWVGKDQFVPEVRTNSGGKTKVYFKNDTLQLFFTKWLHYPEKDDITVTSDLLSQKPAMDFKAEGLIVYTLKDRTFFYEIPTFRKLEPRIHR